MLPVRDATVDDIGAPGAAAHRLSWRSTQRGMRHLFLRTARRAALP